MRRIRIVSGGSVKRAPARGSRPGAPRRAVARRGRALAPLGEKRRSPGTAYQRIAPRIIVSAQLGVEAVGAVGGT